MEQGAKKSKAEELLGRILSEGRLAGVKSAALLHLDGLASASMLIDGEIYRGKDHSVRLERLTLDYALGERGTIAWLCGDFALERALRKELLELPRASLLFSRADGELSNATAGLVYDCAAICDPDALRIFDGYARTVALALMSLIHLYDPERILIAGRAARMGERFTAPIEAVLRGKCFYGEYAAVELIDEEALI
ncbi:MAG: hypothetical protein AAGU74_06945 [Bacillota bacterium]